MSLRVVVGPVLAASVVLHAASAAADDSWRVLLPLEISRVDVSTVNAQLGAAGYGSFPHVRAPVPIPEIRGTRGKISYSIGLFRYAIPLHARGSGGAATAGGGTILPFELGFVALQKDNWEISPFGGAGLGLSYLTLSPAGSPLPAGIFASQGRFDVPLRLGIHITRTLDTWGGTLFGYAEPGHQGAGPTLTLEAGMAMTPGAAWLEDSGGVGSGLRSRVSGLGAQGPFVRLAAGFGAWHVGRGPW